MKTISTQYLDITGKHPAGNKVKVHTYYHLGGHNWFSGNAEKRGIYISVTPVTKTVNSEIQTAYTGTKFLALPLKRWSKKYEDFCVDTDTTIGCIQYVAASNKIPMSLINLSGLICKSK